MWVFSLRGRLTRNDVTDKPITNNNYNIRIAQLQARLRLVIYIHGLFFSYGSTFLRARYILTCRTRLVFKHTSMADKPAVVGGCQCGQVQYRSAHPAHGLTFCYCSICRRLHGGPFAPWTNIARTHLEWVKDDGLVTLSLSDVATRTFCRDCHSPITMVYKAVPEKIGISASSIDEGRSAGSLPNVKRHIFVAERPSWYVIMDSATQFERLPDDMKRYIA